MTDINPNYMNATLANMRAVNQEYQGSDIPLGYIVGILFAILLVSGGVALITMNNEVTKEQDTKGSFNSKVINKAPDTTIKTKDTTKIVMNKVLTH